MKKYLIISLLSISLLLSMWPYVLSTPFLVTDRSPDYTYITASPTEKYFVLQGNDLNIEGIYLYDTETKDVVTVLPIDSNTGTIQFTADDSYIIGSTPSMTYVKQISSGDQVEFEYEDFSWSYTALINTTHYMVQALNTILTFSYDGLNLDLVGNVSIDYPSDTFPSLTYRDGFNPSGQYILGEREFRKYLLFDTSSGDPLWRTPDNFSYSLRWFDQNTLFGYNDEEMVLLDLDLNIIRQFEHPSRVERIRQFGNIGPAMVISVVHQSFDGVISSQFYQLIDDDFTYLGYTTKEIDQFLYLDQKQRFLLKSSTYEDIETTFYDISLSNLRFSSFYHNYAGIVNAFLLVSLFYLLWRREDTENEDGQIEENGLFNLDQNNSILVFGTKIWMYQNIGVLFLVILLGFDLIRGFPSSSVVLRWDTAGYSLIVSLINYLDIIVINLFAVTFFVYHRQKSEQVQYIFPILSIIWTILGLIWRDRINLFAGLFSDFSLKIAITAFFFYLAILGFFLREIKHLFPDYWERYGLRLKVLSGIILLSNLIFVLVAILINYDSFVLVGEFVLLKYAINPLAMIILLRNLLSEVFETSTFSL